MARPTSKIDLIDQSEKKFSKLLDLITPLNEKLMCESGACEKWSIKDILAHLNEWHKMVLNWVEIGGKNGKPEIPGRGYTWRQTPELNHAIYLEHKDDNLDLVLKNVKSSHTKVMNLIENYSNEELFTRSLFKWTGNNALGAYFVSCTASHYDWASKEIKKFLRGY